MAALRYRQHRQKRHRCRRRTCCICRWSGCKTAVDRVEDHFVEESLSMRAPAGLHIVLGLCLSATLGLTTSGFSRAPPADNQPRLAAPVPTRAATIQPTAAPDAATPIAPTPGQPTTAAASDPTATPTPTPVTQVSGPPAGVTQLPNSTATSTTSSSLQAATAAYRGYSASRFALALEGVQAGTVNAVEGGTPTADVVTEKTGSDNIAHKHVAGLKYEVLSFTT